MKLLNEKICGIYKITSPSNKIYIGQSVDILKRLNKYKKLNCKSQSKLYRSFLKYGFQSHSFEIIEKCDIYSLNNKERYWQEYYNCISDGLNCLYQRTDVKKQIMSDITKNKISNTTKGKIFSEKTKEKISQSLKGKPKSKEHIKKISESNKGKKRNKISKETLLKLSQNNKNSKIVLDLNTGVYYNSVSELSKLINIKFSTLNAKLSGQNVNNTQYVIS
jgi:group I intron endonuclease